MSNQIIVADTGPLIAFAKIDHFALLSDLFGIVLIPEEVANEYLLNLSLPGAQNIQNLIQKNQIKIHSSIDTQAYASLSGVLDQGEISAIALALELNSRLLIDERLGRISAKKLGLKIIGTAGVLLLAKQRKLIKQVKPFLLELKSSGYYLSDELSNEIIKLAKE